MDRQKRLEKNLKVAKLIASLKDHKGMQELEKTCAELVDSINAKLLSYEKLETLDREILIADKQRLMWFINMFPNAEQTIKKITKQLEQYD